MTLTDRNHTKAGGGQPLADPPHFLGGSIDDVPRLLTQSYRLRYEVYCLERKFLPAEQYPTGLESDEFDRHSLHVGAVDSSGELAGTSRAVMVSELGLPLFEHCTSFPHETEFHKMNPLLVEVGRLVVDRCYRRRRNDVVCGVHATAAAQIAEYRSEERRRVGDDAVMTVLKALYHATRRVGATHWLTAMEESLRQLLAQQGFPFRAFGPESEYYGIVAPYQMALKELDAVIQSGRFPGLDEFTAGGELDLDDAPHAATEPDDTSVPSRDGR